MSAGYIGRLAPSPTGALHLGNVRTFMVAWLRARSLGGRVILRIEDLDHPRDKPGAAAQAVEDLRWLGFDWVECTRLNNFVKWSYICTATIYYRSTGYNFFAVVCFFSSNFKTI